MRKFLKQKSLSKYLSVVYNHKQMGAKINIFRKLKKG